MFVLEHGPIPEGRELRRRDVCHTPWCVSPRHATITRRRAPGSSVCPHHGPRPDDGFYLQAATKVCKVCATERRARYAQRKKLAAA
jgi:hypothetical protein